MTKLVGLLKDVDALLRVRQLCWRKAKDQKKTDKKREKESKNNDK